MDMRKSAKKVLVKLQDIALRGLVGRFREEGLGDCIESLKLQPPTRLVVFGALGFGCEGLGLTRRLRIAKFCEYGLRTRSRWRNHPQPLTCFSGCCQAFQRVCAAFPDSEGA